MNGILALAWALTLCTDAGCQPATAPIVFTGSTVTTGAKSAQFRAAVYDIRTGVVLAYGDTISRDSFE